MFKIEEFEESYTEEMIAFILEIQRQEFLVNISEADQPDLQNIWEHYMQTGGNFWLAKDRENKVIGTIGIVRLADGKAALKKMFAAREFRGASKLGQALLNQAVLFCEAQGFTDIYLGTTDRFVAAQKFYQKNDFKPISKESLPTDFPTLEVDNVFLKKPLT